MSCASAFPETFDGSTEWVLKSGMAKQKWVELKLKTQYQLLELQFKPVKSQNNNIRKLKVIFDDKQSQLFTLLKLESMQSFKFDSKQSKSLTFEIMETYQNEIETGGSFNVIGLKCKSLEVAEPLSPDQIVPVGCGENMFNNPLLSA